MQNLVTAKERKPSALPALQKVKKKQEGDAAGSVTAAETMTASDQRVQIALRAYALYEQRGRQDGHAEDDWLQAERELLEGSPERQR